jgi:hypothetical protein
MDDERNTDAKAAGNVGVNRARKRTATGLIHTSTRWIILMLKFLQNTCKSA